MKTIKLEGGIWAQYDKRTKKFDYSYAPGGMTCPYFESQGYIPISPYIIELEMPDDIDLHKGALVALQAKRKLILAKNQSDLNVVDAEIQEFMAIEHKEV